MFGKFFSNIFGGGSPQRSNTSNPSGEVFYQQNGQTYYDAPWLQQPILQPTNNSSYNYPASQQSYMDAVGMPTPSPTPTNNRGNQGGNNNQITITGGTGPAERDVTPEATERVVERIMPGFGEQMRAISLEFVPTAILSRQVGGTRGKSLIFNLPGRPKAIRETIDEIWKAVPYCVDLLGGPYIDMKDDVCNAFRPKNARRR